MRDLAQQNYSLNRDRIAIPRSAVRIVLILAVVLAVLFGARFINSNNGGLIGGSAVVLKDAPKGLTPVKVPGVVNITEGAVNLVVESAAFTNVSGGNATAAATRKYGAGSYSLTVNATLPDPGGNVYQVWIVGDDAIFLAGDMRGSGSSWSIGFNDVDNYSSLDGIWITREITNNDNKPEKHILEGSF